MGASNRSMLAGGRLPTWEKKLRAASVLISEVAAEVMDAAGDDGQYDNAADDGGLAESLLFAKRIIDETLPDGGKCQCCGRVRGGP